MQTCKCGCGGAVKGKRVFLNKEHQLAWMAAGGAAEIGALQPLEAKALGGAKAGRMSVENGKLAEASKKGAERAREIANEFRARKAGVK